MPNSEFDHASAAPTAAFIAWVFGETIKAKLPELVEKLAPASKKGLRASDRAAQLAKLDAELASLRAQRDELVTNLADAQSAIAK